MVIDFFACAKFLFVYPVLHWKNDQCYECETSYESAIISFNLFKLVFFCYNVFFLLLWCNSACLMLHTLSIGDVICFQSPGWCHWVNYMCLCFVRLLRKARETNILRNTLNRWFNWWMNWFFISILKFTFVLQSTLMYSLHPVPIKQCNFFFLFQNEMFHVFSSYIPSSNAFKWEWNCSHTHAINTNAEGSSLKINKGAFIKKCETCDYCNNLLW